MKKLLIAATAVALSLVYCHADEDLWESTGPHVRIKRNDHDGSHVVFRRNPDDKKLVKTTKDQNGNIKMTAIYYRNDKGFLTAGQIRDGLGNRLYRVRYGYDKNSGLLIAEDMFDARVKNYYPDHVRDTKGNRKEMPVRRIYYFYDAQGNQSKAISLVPRKGKTAEEVFSGSGDNKFYKEEPFDPNLSTRPDQNPFDQEKKQQQKR